MTSRENKEFCENYFAARRIFNSLLRVFMEMRSTRSFVFDMLQGYTR